MNIVYNNKDTTCKFCMIATGDVFFRMTFYT